MSVVTERLQRYHRAFVEHIRFRTVPIGICVLKDKRDVPDGTYLPSDDPAHPTLVTTCQLAHIARYTEQVVGFYRPFSSCAPGMRLAGVIAMRMENRTQPGKPPAVGVYLKDDPQAIANSKARFRGLPKGETDAVVAGPLHTLTILPDLVMQYGNPAQIDRLVKAYAWATGKAPSYRGGGGMAEFCYSGLVSGYLDREMAIVNDWEGRTMGYTQDDELAVTIPFEVMDALLEGLEAQRGLSFRYPYSPTGLPGFDLGPREKGFDPQSAQGVGAILGMSRHWEPMLKAAREQYGEGRLKVDSLGRKVSG